MRKQAFFKFFFWLRAVKVVYIGVQGSGFEPRPSVVCDTPYDPANACRAGPKPGWKNVRIVSEKRRKTRAKLCADRTVRFGDLLTRAVLLFLFLFVFIRVQVNILYQICLFLQYSK